MSASHRSILVAALGFSASTGWAQAPTSAEVAELQAPSAAPGAGQRGGAEPAEPVESGVIHGIINGEAAQVDDHPTAGGLLIEATLRVPGYGNFPYVSFLCSSTLIAPDVILLAAHCVDEAALTGGQGELTALQFGWSRQADLSGFGPRRADWPEDTVMIRGWVKHEDFNVYRLRIGLADNHDIALAFLDTPILDVAPALLPTAEEGAALEVGDRVIAVGWGQQSATSQTEAPPPGTFAIKMMGESTIVEMSDEEMKIGEERTDVRKCHGDSGGPSYFFLPEAESDDLMRVVGVTSHAYDYTDCYRTGGVDTRVDHHLEWIDETLRAACEDGTRVWCDEPGILPTSYNDLPEDEAEADGAVADGEDEGKGGLGCAAAPARGDVGFALFGAVGAVGALGLARRRRA